MQRLRPIGRSKAAQCDGSREPIASEKSKPLFKEKSWWEIENRYQRERDRHRYCIATSKQAITHAAMTPQAHTLARPP